MDSMTLCYDVQAILQRFLQEQFYVFSRLTAICVVFLERCNSLHQSSFFSDPSLFESNRQRSAPKISPEVNEERVLLSKEWARHTMKSHREELHKLQVRAKSRQDALKELKKISIELFTEATKVNRTMFPLILNGPVETPAFKDYIPPDLDDVNIKQSKKA